MKRPETFNLYGSPFAKLRRGFLLSRVKRGIAPSRVKGFTMAELLIVMIIMGMMAGVLLPTFFNFTKYSRLRAAARNITSALRNARSYAITQRKNYDCTIYLTDNAVSIYETPDFLKKLYMPENIDLTDRDNDTEGDPDGTDITFTFTSRGTASTDYPTPVIGERTMRIFDKIGAPAGSHYIELDVNNITGRVKMDNVETK